MTTNILLPFLLRVREVVFLFLCFYIGHLTHYLALAFEEIGCGMGAVEPERVGQRSGYKGTLLLGQARGGGGEMVLRHCLGSVDAVTHLYGVEIDFHDALLAPHEFDEEGEIGLETFAHP